MKYRFTLIVCGLILPNLAGAQGLVSCEGTNCDFCDIAQTADNVITFVISLLVLVSVLIMAYAGFRMVTSAGDTSSVEEAKKLLTNVIIGFIIILSSWTIVDTVLKALVGNNVNVLEVWKPIDCGGMATPKGLNDYGPVYNNDLLSETCNPGTSNFPDCAIDPNAGNPAKIVSTAACAPLNNITDPVAVQMENGSKVVWTKTDPNLKACALKLGGTVTSAYRPQAYQDHLRELKTKWCDQGLKDDPFSCPAVYTAVSAEIAKHGLSSCPPVAVSSNHTSGLAVDISGGPQKDGQCMRWFGPSDKVHYTLVPGCSCN